MKRRSFHSTCILSVLITVIGIVMPGCHHPTSRPSDAGSVSDGSELPEDSVDSAIMLRVDSILSGMTLEQMAGQLVFPAIFSVDDESALRQVAAYAADCHIGGVVLLKGSSEAARNIADTLSALSCAPPFVAIDAEWGLAMRLNDTPRYPKNGRISPAVEDSILYSYGREVALECREVGINMVLGPVLDVLPESTLESGRKSFLGLRSFGSDVRRVTRRGISYAKGLEDAGVMSVAKHFPGHGAADEDSHRHLPLVRKTREQLDSTDLHPFKKYMSEGLGAVMVGHLKVPALDSSGVPVSMSEKILKDMIRDELGFNGLIMTDAINMAGADGKSAADAIMAGADIVIAPGDTYGEVMMIADAVTTGKFPLSQLRDRVRRVLLFKLKFAIPSGSMSSQKPNPEQVKRALSE